ncbi:hypothetical protein KS4_11580 [Poriferisphaera corsica]|uniref:Uncharacterized protein n=1 Tax=Poriferisphaera corsica TaxID=2528020 RepID=A0A517YSC5_9BACT|nr:hypothetical protein KS4_11580 [Poriferisphaera corsica]
MICVGFVVREERGDEGRAGDRVEVVDACGEASVGVDEVAEVGVDELQDGVAADSVDVCAVCGFEGLEAEELGDVLGLNGDGELKGLRVGCELVLAIEEFVAVEIEKPIVFGVSTGPEDFDACFFKDEGYVARRLKIEVTGAVFVIGVAVLVEVFEIESDVRTKVIELSKVGVVLVDEFQGGEGRGGVNGWREKLVLLGNDGGLLACGEGEEAEEKEWEDVGFGSLHADVPYDEEALCMGISAEAAK